MNNKDTVKLINDLISISIKNEKNNNDSNIPSKSFGIGSSNVSFVGSEAVSKFQDILNTLYSFNKEIFETISLKTFEGNIISLIRMLRDKGKKCDLGDFNTIIDHLLSTEIYESEILYELFGAVLDMSFIKFGDFTIYNYLLASDLLVQKHPYLKKLNWLFDGRRTNIYLGVKVTSRETDRATEIADDLVETFVNVMNYMIADLNHQQNIGVFNFGGWTNANRIICSNSAMGFHKNSKISFPVSIKDPFFIDQMQGNDKAWELITKKNKNELDKRLLQSIEWIGKGVQDKDRLKAFVQFVFAIEGMLQYEDNSLITPSIISQLSDWSAFIIADIPAKRMEISKYFKQIYKTRSAIVHGGPKSVDLKALHIALQIAKLLVVSFLTKKPFCNMKSIQQVSEHIVELKFK